MSDFPFSIPRNKSVTRPPYSFTKYNDPDPVFTVKKGTPDDDDPDQFDGEISDMATIIDIPNDNTDVMLSGKILGEWGSSHVQQRNTGLVIHRKRVINGVTTQTILRPPEKGIRGRIISTFATNWYSENYTSSMEQAPISYMDTVDAGIITYTPVLVFSDADNANASFRINGTHNAANDIKHEVGTSLFLVQAMS